MDDVFILLNLSAALTANVASTDTTVQIEIAVERKGLGVAPLAIPQLQENTDIGIALKMEECMAIDQSFEIQ